MKYFKNPLKNYYIIHYEVMYDINTEIKTSIILALFKWECINFEKLENMIIKQDKIEKYQWVAIKDMTKI